MTFAPLLEASFAIQMHTAAAIFAAAFGCLVMILKKGTGLHRRVGYCFVVSIMLAAATSFWIKEIIDNSFSPIHILSLVTLVSVPLAIVYRRRGNIRGHALAMIGPFIGLIIAGAATLLPGRIIHRILFG